jgi:hypothetical protein
MITIKTITVLGAIVLEAVSFVVLITVQDVDIS